MQLYEVIQEKEREELLKDTGFNFKTVRAVEIDANEQQKFYAGKVFELRGGKRLYRFTFEKLTSLELNLEDF